MSPRKTWEYCDIPICGMYYCSATQCHPARHGNIVIFLYVVCIIMVLHNVTPQNMGILATFLYVVRMVLHYVTPQNMGILRHSYMWYVLLWCYTMSPRKTWEYCDIPICGKDGATLCHPTRHGNTATFLYVVLLQKPYTDRKIQKATWQHKNATKYFDYTTIAVRLRTVSWVNDWHPISVVKPVNGIPTFPTTDTPACYINFSKEIWICLS